MPPVILAENTVRIPGTDAAVSVVFQIDTTSIDRCNENVVPIGVKRALEQKSVDQVGEVRLIVHRYVEQGPGLAYASFGIIVPWNNRSVGCA